MSKHTQGEWRYVDGYLDCEVRVGNKIVLSYERNPSDENRANARLVASAPDLLEACTALVVFFTPLAKDCTAANWIDKARAAIAKATGGDL